MTKVVCEITDVTVCLPRDLECLYDLDVVVFQYKKTRKETVKHFSNCTCHVLNIIATNKKYTGYFINLSEGILRSKY